MSIIVVGPEDGEQAGGGPIRCRIIEDGSHTEHRLGLIEVIVPAGPAMPPQHIHHKFEEIFIVTRGRLRFTSGDESVDVGSRILRDGPSWHGSHVLQPLRRAGDIHQHADAGPLR